MSGFLILILILGAAWLLFIVPARRRRQSHQSMQDSVDIGDEIITAGGLHGFVREMGDDTLRVEISPGVVATLDRRAVAAVAREVEVEVEPEPEPEPTEDHHELPEEDPKNGADTSKRANESPAEPG
jgi:preprotein translocase subunit YajC